MTRMLLTVICARHDADAIAQAIAAAAGAPVHRRDEAVLGRDFGDAATRERVAGSLARVAVEIELAGDRVADAVAAARDARRRLPFRWRSVAIADGGRVA